MPDLRHFLVHAPADLPGPGASATAPGQECRMHGVLLATAGEREGSGRAPLARDPSRRRPVARTRYALQAPSDETPTAPFPSIAEMLG
jgi:hypothetical protein